MQFTEEEQVNDEAKQDHEHWSEEEHGDEIGGPTAERVLLEHPAVAVGEDHVEEEVEADGAEEEEGRHEAPELPVPQDQGRVVVELRHFWRSKWTKLIYMNN